MSAISRPASCQPSGRRADSVIATLLLIMLALMIARNIPARGWSVERPALPDVTRRSL